MQSENVSDRLVENTEADLLFKYSYLLFLKVFEIL